MKNRIFTAAGLFTASAAPALAHHPLGGMPMETFAHGVLSGVGHPLLGFDHLLFVVAVGVAALLAGRRLMGPAAYIVAMLTGCLLMSAGVGLPLKEAVIGLSLLVVGGLVLSGRKISGRTTMALFAFFGLFHGSAFGEAIVGQEAGMGASVLIGYLIGLGAVQFAIAVGAGVAMTALFRAASHQAVEARIAGAVVAGAGLLLSLETAEGALFDMMGWAV